MAFKRLKSSKNIKSETLARLSLSAKEQIDETVRQQFMETMKLPAEFGKVSDNINTLGYSVLRISHNFNEYCEIISKTAVYQNSIVDICDLIRFIFEKSRPFVEQKNILLSLKIPEEKIFVNIDKERFSFAFLNLLLNSAENTPEKGKIRIIVSKTKKFVKITVADNGIGMDEETVLHCAEPFFSKNFFREKPKMGLGLTLVHHFVSENGGRISLRSEKDKGTFVSMLLPLVEGGKESVFAGSSVPDLSGDKFSPVYIMLSGIGKE